MAGAAVGAATGIGPQMGWALGTVLAGALFPAKQAPQQRGKIDEAHLSSSSYGIPIPLVFGQGRVGGNVIWITDLKQSVKRSRINKKGPRVEEYSYSLSVAVGLCEGPVAGVRRIWADDLLIYDTRKVPATEYNIKVYTGTETQTPDPTVEAVQGTGKTPAYRGLCYFVITDMPLAKFANRPPFFSAEIAPGTALGVTDYESFFTFEDSPGLLVDSGTNRWDLDYRKESPFRDYVVVEQGKNGANAIRMFPDPDHNYGGPNRAVSFLPEEFRELTVMLWAKYRDDNHVFGYLFFGIRDPNDPNWQTPLWALMLTNEGGGRADAVGWEFVSGNTYTPHRYHQIGVDFDVTEVDVAKRPWRHICWTFKGKKDGVDGRSRLYVDGQLKSEVTVTNEIPWDDIAGTGGSISKTIAIQSSWGSGDAEGTPTGTFIVDSAGFTDRELTQAEIQHAMTL